MATTRYIKPTESELEILQVLWKKGLATVREVLEELAAMKVAGYTTRWKYLLGKMIDSLFGGSPTQLVIQALGEHKATEEELKKIQEMLDNLKNK